MLQLTGCVLIIAGCAGIAAVICRDYNSRLDTLMVIRDIYEEFKYYISYPVGKRKDAVFGGVLRNL